MFSQGIKAPFLGAATFGEHGSFPGPKPINRHGNLMCDAILFESWRCEPHDAARRDSTSMVKTRAV
jgi:hypothetical protein